MVNRKVIVCEICGKTVEVDAKRKLNYCDNKSCEQELKKRRRKEVLQKYYERTHNTVNVRVEEIEREVRTPLEVIKQLKAREDYFDKEKNETNKKINTTAIENVDIADLLEISRELGEIRYRLIQKIEQERENIKKYEHEDNTLVHAFEFEELSKEEVWERYLENKESRTKRRMSKYRHAILKAMLDNITIKNPNKFVVTAINGGKGTRDFEEYVEELKKDDSLFKA